LVSNLSKTSRISLAYADSLMATLLLRRQQKIIINTF